MRSPNSLKREFLKKWIKGLQVFSSSKKDKGILERKKVIKLSADVAMASARNSSTCWSRALIANASKNEENKILVDHILGESEKIKRASIASLTQNKIVVMRSKKILKKSRSVSRQVKKMAPRMDLASSSLAKKLVKKRTQVLKRLIPGGETMDEFCLMEETLDYIVSLRAQIDVMRRLVDATEESKS